MTRDDIYQIMNEELDIQQKGYSNKSQGFTLAADRIIEKFKQEKEKYPFEKVREFLGFVTDKVFLNEYDIATILPAGDVLEKAKELLEEINEAELSY